MGIDIYLKWPEQSVEDAKKQITGFAIDAGDRGYLREAYHGGPYATETLLPETWDDSKYVSLGTDPQYPEEEVRGVPYKAATLRERLPAALDTCRERSRQTYNIADPENDPGTITVCKSFENFVAFAERMEKEHGAIYVTNSY
jgi:hypothetical protein